VERKATSTAGNRFYPVETCAKADAYAEYLCTTFQIDMHSIL
jgi:hypothetical protein